MKTLLVFSILLHWITPINLPPNGVQEASAAAVFRRLQDCVSELLLHFPSEQTESGQLAKTIDASANVITDKWMNAARKDVSRDYLRTLISDCSLIDQASQATDDQKANDILKDVSEDLKVKAQHARRIVGAGEALGTSIKVVVRSQKKDHLVDGYLVRCNPRRYSTQSPAMFLFNNPTNHAERALPPGNYTFWLETQNGQVVISRDITIGGDGQTSEPPIVFDVP